MITIPIQHPKFRTLVARRLRSQSRSYRLFYWTARRNYYSVGAAVQHANTIVYKEGMKY